MTKILDSGARRDFGTGAVRDCAEGKGRCDLLPVDIIAELYKQSRTHDLDRYSIILKEVS